MSFSTLLAFHGYAREVTFAFRDSLKGSIFKLSSWGLGYTCSLSLLLPETYSNIDPV